MLILRRKSASLIYEFLKKWGAEEKKMQTEKNLKATYKKLSKDTRPGRTTLPFTIV